MADLRANIPEFRTPIIDVKTGMIDPVWWQFFIKLFDRTGAEQGSDGGGVIIDITILKKLVDQIYGLSIGQAIQPPFKQKEYPETLAQLPQRAAAPIAFPFDVPTHGLQYDPALHAVATPTDSGFMSAADKTKLDSIAGTTSNFMVYQSVAQAIPAGVITFMTFTTKVFDDTTEYLTGTSQFVAANAGTYVFVTGVTGTQATATYRQVGLYVNGAQRTVMQERSPSIGGVALCGTSGPTKLAAGDAVRISYFSTLADNTLAGQAITYFGGWRIK